MAPDLSFIVPAYNEAAVLGVTLTGLHRAGRATGRRYEIVVADDDSDDGTAELAAGLGARVVRERHRQIAATRNAGGRAARGRYLIFVDADTIVPPGAVGAALAALDDGLVGGGGAFRFDGERQWSVWLTEVVANLGYRWARLATGCFIFCRRDAFLAVGGFDESLYIAEEVVFAKALGRFGRVQALRHPVLTSARKLRTHGGWTMFWPILRGGLLGFSSFRRREGHEVWYGERRADPAV